MKGIVLRYRILKKKYNKHPDYTDQFIPQKRVLWFWVDIGWNLSLADAKDRIRSDKWRRNKNAHTTSYKPQIVWAEDTNPSQFLYNGNHDIVEPAVDVMEKAYGCEMHATERVIHRIRLRSCWRELQKAGMTIKEEEK